MSNSKPYLVINGYIEQDKAFSDYEKVVTAAGENLLIESKGIVKSFPIEASGESGLTRIFVEHDTNIWLGVSSGAIQALSNGGSDIGLKSILKWVDDGETISKSRDDTFSSESLP